MKNNTERTLAYIALVLGLAQLFVILLSWICSAADLMSHEHSLLSPEGIRWFFGHFVENLCHPLLVWLLLISIAGGCLYYSNLLQTLHSLFRHENISLRERIALWLVFIEFVVYICAVFMLTVVPHAILLSATGNLFPSPFSYSLIPIISFGLCLVAISYGLMAGSLNTLNEVFLSLTIGIKKSLPVWLYYILVVELYYSIHFAFMTV